MMRFGAAYRRRPGRLTACGAVAVVLGAVGAVAVLAPTGAYAASTGSLVSAANGKCLDVANNSTADGATVHMWTCYPTVASQKWTLADDGSVRSQGKCLDVANNSTANGAVVHIWTCYATVTTQKWTLTAAGDLVNAASGKCLDIRDNNQADGAPLQI
ncbi:ricin-type beta-trefoil lectin domain protein [Micromonospora sp. NPDC018662]|uniref:ricin-type beta-trefoil lectin domain protein n=1 Tax=Micromonospora sp. NPDC018662 TaxID=3364238 RepID=UPI0037B1C8B7